MKKTTTILLLLLCTSLAFAQTKEKIKGSKAVTTKLENLTGFKSIEVGDNLEIYLEKGESPSLKIEADDNLHDIIATSVKDSVLYLSTTKEAYRFKKMMVYVTYTNALGLVTAKNEAMINALQELQLDTLKVKAYNEAKLFLNVNTKNFVLETNDKVRTELNLKSEKGKVILSQNSFLKALVKTENFTCDLYQKTTAEIEGNSTNAKIRLDNNGNFTGRKFSCKNIKLIAESYSNCSINAETDISISANGKSEIQLIGSPKIEMVNFADEVKLFKKTK
ncbi:DUF2807 domain-containing protein [Flavobacterium faecale]|uniref:DUF2807 domain-containing protein n=1 Tax=Flavobacterium faecale TaxID=1355330 RepID=A0A2S1LD03_9FLAO|nr:DUF2807 domain-containing protein [Flavobacterium faecale]AWG21588.1 DUF2807 domain-containing protein [Flavobacterium faecale]